MRHSLDECYSIWYTGRCLTANSVLYKFHFKRWFERKGISSAWKLLNLVCMVECKLWQPAAKLFCGSLICIGISRDKRSIQFNYNVSQVKDEIQSLFSSVTGFLALLVLHFKIRVWGASRCITSMPYLGDIRAHKMADFKSDQLLQWGFNGFNRLCEWLEVNNWALNRVGDLKTIL